MKTVFTNKIVLANVRIVDFQRWFSITGYQFFFIIIALIFKFFNKKRIFINFCTGKAKE
jgi:hypothetical protein